jgi:hypothetical protein
LALPFFFNLRLKEGGFPKFKVLALILVAVGELPHGFLGLNMAV